MHSCTDPLTEPSPIDYADQGGLNIVITAALIIQSGRMPEGKNFKNYSVKFPEFPVNSSDTNLYNVRSKKTQYEAFCKATETNEGEHKFNPYPPDLTNKENGHSILDWYVKEGKLYTSENKQIKVWHYCAALGAYCAHKEYARFCKEVNIIKTMFNEETKQFFKEECGCGDFFEKEFTL